MIPKTHTWERRVQADTVARRLLRLPRPEGGGPQPNDPKSLGFARQQAMVAGLLQQAAPMSYDTDPRYATNDYPVLCVVREPAANGSLPRAPVLEHATFLSDCSFPEGRAIVRLDGSLVDPKEVRCYAMSPGFSVTLCAERTVYRKAVLVGVKFRRTDPNASEACLVRFACGDSHAETSITVPAGV